MPTASQDLAVLILCIFTLVALLGWWFKTQITAFARALLIYRQNQQRRRANSTTATTAQSV